MATRSVAALVSIGRSSVRARRAGWRRALVTGARAGTSALALLAASPILAQTVADREDDRAVSDFFREMNARIRWQAAHGLLCFRKIARQIRRV